MKKSTWITWAVVVLVGISTIAATNKNDEGTGASVDGGALILDLAIMTGVVWGISLLIQWIYLKVATRRLSDVK